MIPKGIVLQFGMIAVSAGIALTYIKPEFDNITVVQDDTVRLQEEIEKVQFVNNSLQRNLTIVQAVSVDEHERLENYMPVTIDYIKVSRDLALMVREAGLAYQNVSYTEVRNQRSNNRSGAITSIPYDFTVEVEGSYDNIKTLLDLFTQNNYPLEVSELSLTSGEGGLLSATIALVTYAQE